MAETIVYLNGRLLPAREAQVSAFDHGLLYGLAVFETMRSYQGKLFRLAQHLARLERGAQELGIPLPPEGLEGAVSSVLEAVGLQDARVRITVTGGTGQAGPPALLVTGPTVLATASPLPPEAPDVWEKGHKAIISAIRRSSQAATLRLKTTNRIENVLAQREAQEKGADQAVLLNEKRCITECPSANIFFVAYGRVVTPSVDCGLLPGITREAVMELALEMGMAVEDRWISVEEIWDAEEIFVTSSVMGLFPITSVNNRPVRGSLPGKITRALMLAYQGLVGRELALAASPGSR